LQARQQLLELQGLREELSARSQQLAELKQAYESVKVSEDVPMHMQGNTQR
jgi:hypothetical protein